jgi:carbonic anhydrase
MDKLIRGYSQFRSEVFPRHKHRFKLLANSQKPHTLFITCSDSRVEPSLILQTDPGELFICRVVGNLIPAHGYSSGGVASAVEYAVTVLGVNHVVVCGHSDCGAMRAFLHPEKLKSLKAVECWLDHARAAIDIAKDSYGHLEGDEFLEALIQENVISQIRHLRTHPSVATQLKNGSLQVHGWYYDIGNGLVTAYDEANSRFLPLDESRVATELAIA